MSSETGELVTKCVVVDFSALTYIDPSGVELMRQLTNEYEQLDVAFYIACCSGKVTERTNAMPITIGGFQVPFTKCSCDVSSMKTGRRN